MGPTMRRCVAASLPAVDPDALSPSAAERFAETFASQGETSGHKEPVGYAKKPQQATDDDHQANAIMEAAER